MYGVTFDLVDGYVQVDWGRLTKSQILTPREAFQIAEAFARVGAKAAQELPSVLLLPPLQVTLHGCYVAVDWGVAHQQARFTAAEAARVADALEQVAYKSERNEAGLLRPTMQDVERMEHVLCGEGHHVLLHHAHGAPGASRGWGVRLNGSFLSRWIRKTPWFR